VSIVYFGVTGYTFYKLPIEQRFFHPAYQLLKPSGLIGHGLGIIGSVFLVVGLFSYMARKRLKMFSRWGVLKYWLEFHIFLCTLGSVLVLFHTSFKFGGIISVGFWSMALVWISGVVGRYIYIQIPHTIEGRELSLQEIDQFKQNLDKEFNIKYNIQFGEIQSIRLSKIRQNFASKNISKKEYNKALLLIKKEKKLQKQIKRLDKMRNMFTYWHFAHLPFALIMLIIMVIHISVSLFFGYKWIF
jgi:hypothetical protein